MSSTPPVENLGLAAAMQARRKGFISTGLIVRIAIATTVAYLLAQEYSGSPLPVFAPMTTLLVVQASPFSTLGMTAQRVLGTALGVGLATVYVNVVPLHWWSVLAVMLLSLFAARALPTGLSGQLQLPIAAVFVVALGPTDLGVDMWRVLDVLLGAAIGVAAVFIAPPRPQLQPAARAVSAYVTNLAALLRRIADDVTVEAERALADGVRHSFIAPSRALRDQGERAHEAYADAVESGRFNLRRGDADVDLGQLAQTLRWADRLTIQARSLAGAVDVLYDRPGREPVLAPTSLGRLLHRLADLVEARGAGRSDAAERASDRLVAELRAAARRVTGRGQDPAGALGSLGVLGRVEQLRELAHIGPGAEGEIEERVAAAIPAPTGHPARARPGRRALSARLRRTRQSDRRSR